MSSRILIADDTPIVLDFLELVFAKQDFDVIRAGSGEQAIQLAHESEPDLLLVDVMMPGVDGFEVCRTLRADPDTTHLPILLYSAIVGEEVRARARAAGADEFLGKTLHHAELVSRVRDWLASRALPGGVGIPQIVEVALDLVGLLQVECVWLLGETSAGYEHLGIACERGEQEALRFQARVGMGPFSAEPGSLMGEILANKRLRVNWPLAEVQQLGGGQTVASAMGSLGALAIGAASLVGPNGEKGIMIYAAPPTLSGDPQGARATGVGLRYAATALGVWDGLRHRGRAGASDAKEPQS